MGWFQVTGGSLRYRGRLTRAPFSAWIATPEGASAMESAGLERRFRFLARSRATRAVWRDLSRAACADPMRGAIQEEAGNYGQLITELAHAPLLPRSVVNLRRLVVVPRSMVAARANSAVLRRLGTSFELGTLNHAVRLFFAEQVLKEMEAAVIRSRPSPRSPMNAGDQWACIGFDDRFEWVDPMWSGPGRLGHLFMFEMPRSSLSRRDRKQLEGAVQELDSGLARLSRVQRHGTVGMATAGLQGQ